jgi:hypothetical protein
VYKLIEKKIISIKEIPNNLLSNLENRDTVLWIRDLGKDTVNKDALVAFLGLPWRLIFMEVYEPELVKAIEAADPARRSLFPIPLSGGFTPLCIPVYVYSIL